MNTIEYFKERFDQLQPVSEQQRIRSNPPGQLFRLSANWAFRVLKHEEWKYTRVAGLFNKEYQFPPDPLTGSITAKDWTDFSLPGSRASQ